jgi:serine/threonine protein kinase
MAERLGTWEKLNSLGRGGQGEVFKARKISTDSSQLIERIQKAISTTVGTQPALKIGGAEELISVLRAIATEQQAPLGALKVLHPITNPEAAEKALGRMRQEVDALTAVKHPSLIRVYDSNITERWFVTEYFQRGTLTNYLERTRGNPFAALNEFRTLVEAVAQLHGKGYIHRDIKPDNIFVADDGQLILGDFGLVIRPDAADARLTDTYENVGSRDWMPGWAFGMRMDDVKPSFDVFCLGKVLWSMISGSRFLRLWYHHRPEFDLQRMFPENPAIDWASTVLDKCVVEHEEDCLKNAGDLLTEVEHAIEALIHGAQILRKDIRLRCWVCGIGSYINKIRDDNTGFILACNHCGHGTFFFPTGRPDWRAP